MQCVDGDEMEEWTWVIEPIAVVTVVALQGSCMDGLLLQ